MEKIGKGKKKEDLEGGERLYKEGRKRWRKRVAMKGQGIKQGEEGRKREMEGKVEKKEKKGREDRWLKVFEKRRVLGKDRKEIGSKDKEGKSR